MEKTKGMIIIGYQGIGKTTTSMAIKDGYIDLESSNNYFRRKENWYEEYCKTAESLAKQGYKVFISSHKEVRETLKNSKEDVDVIAIVPSLKLKDFWIERLYNRYLDDPSGKNERAYLNAKDCYEENIKDIMKDCITVVIENEKYSMPYLIDRGRYLLEIYHKLDELNITPDELQVIKEYFKDRI